MDHQRMPCIIPSNAPALPGNSLHDKAIPSRVLQERSGNRQDDHPDSDHVHRKGEPPSQNDSMFCNDICLNPYTGFERKTPAQIDSESNRLWHRLLRCKPYIKYRSRQPKDAPPNQKLKWPEHMEIAFCRALIYFPPIGRKKVTSTTDNKQRGRNELIAEKIQQWTGERRTRKQVSSHIQVLKPMVKDDKFIMQYLARNEDNRHRHRNERSYRSIYRRQFGPTTMPQRRQLPQDMLSTSRSHLQQTLASPFDMPNINGSKSHTNTHMPFQFDMFVRNTDKDSLSLPLHKFTTLRESNAKVADIQITDLAHLYLTFPQLASVGTEDLYSSQIIMAESTLKLMSGSLSKNAELGIQFELQTQPSCDLGQYEGFQCSTRFFEAGTPIDEATVGHIEYEQHFNRLGNVQFGSKFWAGKVMEMARRLHKARDYRKKAQVCEIRQDAVTAEESARTIELEIRAHISSLTALQELTARRRGSGREVTLLLVCWRFEQTMQDNRGETTWRNVLLLPPRPQPQMLAKEDQSKDEYNPMALGFSLHDTGIGLQAQFEVPHSFDFNDLSTMALADMTPDAGGAQLYSTNDVDFTGGHIHLCLAPDISTAPAVSLDPFHAPFHSVSNKQCRAPYEPAQQWEALPFSNPYFDQTSVYSPLEDFPRAGGQPTASFDGSSTHATLPFDGTDTQTGTLFDGRTNHVANSFGEGGHGSAEVGASHVTMKAEDPLPSIEFMG